MNNPYADRIINRKTAAKNFGNSKLIKRDIVDTSEDQLFNQHFTTEDNEPENSYPKD